MGFKHLLGFFLVIVGIGLTLLLLFLLFDKESLNSSFLLYTGLCAFVSVVSGIFILYKIG